MLSDTSSTCSLACPAAETPLSATTSGSGAVRPCCPGYASDTGRSSPLYSVVTGDVPDYGVVGGNPARLLRRRYSDNDVARLLALAWWDWPPEHISEHVRTLMSGSVDELQDAAPRLPHP